MRKNGKKALSLLLALVLCLGLVPMTALAAAEFEMSMVTPGLLNKYTDIGEDVVIPSGVVAHYNNDIITCTAGFVPMISNNINNQDYTRCATTVKSYLYENPSGGLTRVEYIDGKVFVEDYDSQFCIQASRTIPVELPIWGGFFSGEDYNFVIFGQENKEENDSKEVVRVVKYSKDWERLDITSIFGADAKTTVPFDAGSLRCAESDGWLLIYTSREMYAIGDSTGAMVNHQSNISFIIRQSDMKLDSESLGYISHSFNQFVLVDHEGRVVAMDHGDAHPRAVVLHRYTPDAGGRIEATTEGPKVVLHYHAYESGLDELRIDGTKYIRTYPGASGLNLTGTAVGGLAETTNGYVVAYNYSREMDTIDEIPRNALIGISMIAGAQDIYLAFTDKEMTETTTIQLAPSIDLSVSISPTPVPHLAPTGLDGGYVMWSVVGTSSKTLYYTRYDADGNVGQVKTATAALSDCAPICWNGKVVWYVTDKSFPTFYLLDGSGVTSQQPTTPSNPSNLPAVENIPTTGTAVARTQTVKLDGKGVEFQCYAVKDANGNEINYVKVRDLALALNGTKAQFNVGWDGKISIISNTPYQAAGGEGSTPYSGNQPYTSVSDTPVSFNGSSVNLTSFSITYQGGGYTYYKLRDLGQLLNFNVKWDGGVVIETDKPYTGK